MGLKGQPGPFCMKCGKFVSPDRNATDEFCSCRKQQPQASESIGLSDSMIKAASDIEALVSSFDDNGMPHAPSGDPLAGSGPIPEFKPLAEGTIIAGKYNIVSLCGSGSMGAVYKVTADGGTAVFAVKILHSYLTSEEEYRLRFEREAKIMRGFQHPNLISVYEHGTLEDGAPYLVMDFLSGRTLAEEIEAAGPLPVARAGTLLHAVANALDHAHCRELIHRDIKPGNIVLTQNADGNELVKLVDFGLARDLAAASRLTRTGDILGTPLYMSPEQCFSAPATVQSDIYSLGCVMYETLSGVPPFQGKNAFTVSYKHMNDAPEPLTSKFPELKIPPALDRLVLHCLEKDPEKRPAKASHIAERLREEAASMQTAERWAH